MQSITIVITLLEADRSPLPIARWAQVKGYDADFLKTLRIDLAKIYAPVLAKGEVAPLLDNSGHELAYHHFTSVIQAMRKFPLLTAVNINGKGSFILASAKTRGGAMRGLMRNFSPAAISTKRPRERVLSSSAAAIR